MSVYVYDGCIYMRRVYMRRVYIFNGWSATFSDVNDLIAASRQCVGA